MSETKEIIISICFRFWTKQMQERDYIYWKKRGFKKEFLKNKLLGICRGDVLSILTQFPEEELAQTGLFVKSEKGNLSCIFDGRYTIPFITNNGEIIDGISRTTSEDSVNKYLKPHKTLLSVQRFYNEDFLILSNKPIFICEGIPDCWTLEQIGLSAISACSNNMSDFLLEKLAQFIGFRTITICNDTDPNNAGQLGAISTAKKLMSLGKRHIKILTLPAEEGKKEDINSFYLKYGATTLRELIKNTRKYEV